MPPTVAICPGLYQWTVELESGETRTMLSTEMPPDRFASPVISATRGEPVDGTVNPPVATSLVPPSAQIGDPDFTLHVHGSDFRESDVIVWNGGVEPTTFVSDTELTTGVNMATALFPLPIPILVRQITGAESAVLTFDLQPAA